MRTDELLKTLAGFVLDGECPTCGKDGSEPNPECAKHTEFDLESDDAVEALSTAVRMAREILALQASPKQDIDQFTARESCTVLAALRYWQRTVEEPAEASPDHFEDVEPLNDEEIDDLCERITLDWTKCDDGDKKKLCTDVRCELPADHTGPCKGDDDDDDEDEEEGVLECPHGHCVCPIC